MESWLGISIGIGFAILLVSIYMGSKKKAPEETEGEQNLLQGSVEEPRHLTRHDIEQGWIDARKWDCEICDFSNLSKKKACVLCGTEKGFKLGINSPETGEVIRLSSSSDSERVSMGRKRSFAIRRLNKLNARQRCARKRMEWVRRQGIDGKQHWHRTMRVMDDPTSVPNSAAVPITAAEDEQNSDMEDQQTRGSIGYVAHLVDNPKGGEARLTFVDCTEAQTTGIFESVELSKIEDVAALPFSDKYSWFLKQTGRLIRPWEDGRLKLRVHRENILVESMEQILGVQLEHIRMPLRIEFIGESGVDAGGLEREWFALLSEQLFDDTIGLFRSTHKDTRAFSINPMSIDASVDHLLYFRGAGRLIGRALLEGQLIQAHLCLPLFKHFINAPITFSDLEFLDPDVYRSMCWIRDNEGVEALGLNFTVVEESLDGPKVSELKPGGADIDVTDENKEEYLFLRLKYIMLGSFESQLKSLLEGIFEVIPQYLLMVFDYQELELVLCGVPDIDMHDWRMHTVVSDNLIGEDVVDWFWEILGEMTQEDRARLIQFTTGSSRLPVQGFKGLTSYDGRICLFTLKGIKYTENVYLKAHTCFNRIDLPIYPSKEQLEQVLYQVIEMEITGFTDH